MAGYEGITFPPDVFSPGISPEAFAALPSEPDISTSPNALRFAMESSVARNPKYAPVVYPSHPTKQMIEDAEMISAELIKDEKAYREKYDLNQNSWTAAFEPMRIAQRIHDQYVERMREQASKIPIPIGEVLDDQLGLDWKEKRPVDGLRLSVMLGIFPPSVVKKMMLPFLFPGTYKEYRKLGQHLRKNHPDLIGETNTSARHKESAGNFIKNLSLALQLSPSIPIGMIALDMALNLLPNNNWPIHQALARFTESFFTTPEDTLPLAALTTWYILWTTLAAVRLGDKAVSAIHEFSPRFRLASTIITALIIFGTLALFGPPEGSRKIANLLITSPEKQQEQAQTPSRSSFQDSQHDNSPSHDQKAVKKNKPPRLTLQTGPIGKGANGEWIYAKTLNVPWGYYEVGYETKPDGTREYIYLLRQEQ